MSDGKCGTHEYSNYNQARIDTLLSELKAHNFIVIGNNPWDIDTKKYSIKLRGTWDASKQKLSVIVTDKSIIVPCDKIWAEIDPILEHVSRLSFE